MSSRDRILRALLLGLCAALAIGGMACFTPDAARKHKAATSNLVDYIDPVSDTLLGSARLAPAVEQKLGCTNGVAFLGTNHTYIVTTGGDRLIELSRAVGADRLELECPTGSLVYHKTRFWGSPRLHIDASKTNVTVEVDRTLQMLGFSKDARQQYRATVDIAGVMQDPLQVPATAMSSFARPRTITFYKPVRDYHVAENLSYTFVKLPLALVGDTALVAGAIVAVPVVGILSLLDP